MHRQVEAHGAVGDCQQAGGQVELALEQVVGVGDPPAVGAERLVVDAVGLAEELDELGQLGQVVLLLAGADDDPEAGRVELGGIELGVVDGLSGGRKAEGREAVGELQVLLVGHEGHRVEVFHFGGDGRGEGGGVEEGDGAHAAGPVDDARPAGGPVVAQRGNRPDSRDDHPARVLLVHVPAPLGASRLTTAG